VETGFDRDCIRPHSERTLGSVESFGAKAAGKIPRERYWKSTLDGAMASRQASAAYKDLETQIGQCGIVSFAGAGTSVPFVGAAAGALVIAQAVRLASLEPTARLLQMQLGAPEMTSVADFVDRPSGSVGSIAWQL
jgi:hypothetical protein